MCEEFIDMVVLFFIIWYGECGVYGCKCSNIGGYVLLLFFFWGFLGGFLILLGGGGYYVLLNSMVGNSIVGLLDVYSNVVVSVIIGVFSVIIWGIGLVWIFEVLNWLNGFNFFDVIGIVCMEVFISFLVFSWFSDILYEDVYEWDDDCWYVVCRRSKELRC